MKLLLKLLVLFLLTPLFLQAQNNYKPGYIIGLKNDTLKGSIEYRADNNNPDHFLFIKAGSTSPEEYSNQNTTAVSIYNLDHFERFTTTVSSASITPGTLALRLDSSYQLKLFF